MAVTGDAVQGEQAASSPVQMIDDLIQDEQTAPTSIQAQPTLSSTLCSDRVKTLLDVNKINAFSLTLNTKSDRLPANVHNFVTCMGRKCSTLRNEKLAF